VIAPTGVSEFDLIVRQAELAHQNALAVPNLMQAAAKLADQILLQTIISAGVTFGINTANELAGLNTITNRGPP
jgi:TRAP-type C4-dicarboxylate transport system permease large subunit